MFKKKNKKKINVKKILMIGPIPPPIGGVSVHLERLTNELKLNYSDNFKVYVANTAKNPFLVFFKIFFFIFIASFKPSQYVIHSHISRHNLNRLLASYSHLRMIKFIVTFHSYRDDNLNISYKQDNIIKSLLLKANSIIVVNFEIKEKILKIQPQCLNKIIILPAFIPFIDNFSVNQYQTYKTDLGLTDFIDTHKFIICANAYKITFHNNQDLYGIDLCIELLRLLNETGFKTVGFIFMLPQIGDYNYYNQMMNKIQKYNINNDFIFINRNVALAPLFRDIDLFIRPTNTDGDAISIREALYARTPTIASDVVKRPYGSTLFISRDLDDLYLKTVKILRNIDYEKEKLRNININNKDDLIMSYVDIYL